MTTITLELSDDLAARLQQAGDRLPDLLAFALDMAGLPEGAETSMVTITPASLETIDFLATAPTHQDIIDFKLSAAAQSQLEDLLEKHRDNQLTPQEEAELNTFRQINQLLILLKARARQASHT